MLEEVDETAPAKCVRIRKKVGSCRILSQKQSDKKYNPELIEEDSRSR